MTNDSIEEIQINKLTELSDADFLTFLYSERNREESLNTYQGWNIWAIAGAIITVLCTGYRMLCAHSEEIDWLEIGYYSSGFIGFAFCYKSWFSFVMLFWKRERGVDYGRVKYLKDVVPIPYLIIVSLCSIGFAIYFPLLDLDKRWSLLSILWIWMAIAYILVNINVYINKDRVVYSYFDGMTFSDVKLWIWVEMSISVIFSIIWFHSFRLISSPGIGSPDLEMALCLTAVVFLLYLLLIIKYSDRKSSQMDVLLDDFIYNDRSKESVYQQLRANRMGYGIIEACSQELKAIKKSIDDFEPQKEKIEKIVTMFSNRTFEIDHLRDYFNSLNETMRYVNKCSLQAKVLFNKMKQIEEHVPLLTAKQKCLNLMPIVSEQMNRAQVISEIVDKALKELRSIWDEYGCNKYGGLCSKDCLHRHDRKTMRYRFELMRVKFGLGRSIEVMSSNLCKED